MFNTVLLAAFTNIKNIKSIIRFISDNYIIHNDKIFVLSDVSNFYKKIVTFNIEKGSSKVVHHNIISLHRKKDTNTLYTLNALNEIVKSKNDGFLNSDYNVDWSEFKNCVLLSNFDEEKEEICLRVIKTKLDKIIKLN